jgi:hypothetical protein
VRLTTASSLWRFVIRVSNIQCLTNARQAARLRPVSPLSLSRRTDWYHSHQMSMVIEPRRLGR